MVNVSSIVTIVVKWTQQIKMGDIEALSRTDAGLMVVGSRTWLSKYGDDSFDNVSRFSARWHCIE